MNEIWLNGYICVHRKGLTDQLVPLEDRKFVGPLYIRLSLIVHLSNLVYIFPS